MDEILNLNESVSEGFPSYFFMRSFDTMFDVFVMMHLKSSLLSKLNRFAATISSNLAF